MKTLLTFRSAWFLFVLALAALGTLGARAASVDNEITALSDSALEQAFWDCDALATHEALPMSLGARCAMLGDELKVRHFGGDFIAMLAWWQAHKEDEHAARADPAIEEFPLP